MTPALLTQLLALLEPAPASAAKVCKALGLAQSELNRALAVLGKHPEYGGLGLLDVQDDDGRKLLSLTERGRAWLKERQ